MKNALGLLSYNTWLIESRFAAKMAPIIFRSIEQGTFDRFIQSNKHANEKLTSGMYAGVTTERVWVDDGPNYRIATAKSGKNVAIVPFVGSITKNGESCSYGMRDYENTLAAIAHDSRISAVVLHYNNAPGGSHDGTPEISAIIKQFPKPTVAFVDGYAASAHYYMASQCDHIMMNSQTDSEVGSIGSLIIAENIQNMIEAGNYPKIEIIRAPQSFNKALLNSIEPITDEMRSELKAELKATVDGFIQAVKLGRGEALKEDQEMFTGKMYATEQAIENGLADSKGTFLEAINKAASLTNGHATKNSNKTQSQTMKFSNKVSSFFGRKKSATKLSAEEPAADGDAPRWTEELVFNTDGSGDGAFCIHSDTEGNDREFETKTDANQGNEPPTDPEVTEDDNWSVVSAPAEDSEPAAESKLMLPTISKLNAALKRSQDLGRKQAAEIQRLKTSNDALSKKLDETPAAPATTVIQTETKTIENKYRTSVDDDVDAYLEATKSKK